MKDIITLVLCIAAISFVALLFIQTLIGRIMDENEMLFFRWCSLFIVVAVATMVIFIIVTVIISAVPEAEGIRQILNPEDIKVLWCVITVVVTIIIGKNIFDE